MGKFVPIDLDFFFQQCHWVKKYFYLDKFFVCKKYLTTFAPLKVKAMYAIVEIAGKQYKVEQDRFIYTNRLENAEGTSVSFDKVLLVDNAGKVKLGTPSVAGAKVTAKVLEHLKGDKVIVFKKKRRKGYQKSNGFRASLTKIQIESITA